jgi:hypothetical protein
LSALQQETDKKNEDVKHKECKKIFSFSSEIKINESGYNEY